MAGKKRLNGEGTISYNSKTRRFVARYSYRDELTGKLVRPSFSAKTAEKAMRRMREAQSDRGGGPPLDSEKTTVGDYLAAWLAESARPGVAPSTFERYEQDVRSHIAPVLGDMRLRKLKPHNVEVLKRTLLEKLAPSTANQCLVTLSVALNRAVKWELIDRNPVKAVAKAKSAQPGMACLSEDEAARLVDVVRGTKREALYLLALKCGLRQGELLALKWEDLDGRELTVRRNVDTNCPEPRWGKTKSGEERVITLDEREVAALKRHRDLDASPRIGGLVFCDETGGVLRASPVLYQLRKDLRAAGLPKIRFHDLRDTAATLLLSHGTPVHVVAKILGHKDPALTLRRYAHVLPDAREAAARAMSEYAF